MERMFFAALTSASNIVPQLVQTKRDRLIRLAASIAREALHVCEVCGGSTTTSFEPYHRHLYSSMVRIVPRDLEQSPGSRWPASARKRAKQKLLNRPR